MRYCPLTSNCRISPSRFSRNNVLFSVVSMILNGPYKRESNLPCFSFSSLLVSHLNTRSSTLKSIYLAFLSKIPFIYDWYIIKLSLTLFLLSLISTTLCILLIRKLGSYFSSWIIVIIGFTSWIGNRDWVSYINSKGDLLVDLLVVIRIAHRENFNFES